MKNKVQNSPQSVRSVRYRKCRFSNLIEYDPAQSAMEKAHQQAFKTKPKEGAPVHWHQEPLSSRFVMPVTLSQLRQRLADFPGKMTRHLKGVFLLGGTRRQEDIFFSSLFTYGSYWNECIFLHPFPRARLEMNYTRTPPPHILRDFERVGAVIRSKQKGGVSVHLTVEALRHYYLYDVFTHELGHHVERHRDRPLKRSEGFADWFAIEYGFRNRELQVRSA